MADEVALQAREGELRRFSPAAHFTQAHAAVIGFHLHNGAHETAPVTTVGVTQWRFQRNRDRRSANIRLIFIVKIPR